MTLVIALNLIFCIAVVVAVVAPLAWAIVTQHRSDPAVPAAAQASRPVRARTRGRPRQPAYEPS